MAKRNRITLEVEPRTDSGKNACRRIRAAGRIPANVYGMSLPPFMVAVEPRGIEEVLRQDTGVNTIFTLRLKGEERTRESMIRELQRDPLTERPLHVDFLRVDVTKPVHVKVPIRLVGTATGVKNEGGIVDFVHREVLVECLPADIPDYLEVDVSELHLHQHVSISDLRALEGIKILDDPHHIVAVVSAPKAEEAPAAEAAPEAAATPAEPEVAKKGKEAAEGEKPAPERK
jgi:large subunit ribosomal protein L25